MANRAGACAALLVVASALALGGAGCDDGARRPRDIEAKPSNDPLEPARAVLNRYAKGEPLGSEAASFDGLVAEVRKSDPSRADILDKGLKEIQRSPGSRKAKAKELLGKLGPQMKAK